MLRDVPSSITVTLEAPFDEPHEFVARGYAESDVNKSAANLHGALMLAHGTGDDNVHFQNSIQMIDALIKAGKQFRLMIYPNKTHSIAGSESRDQLFHMIEDHFEQELK